MTRFDPERLSHLDRHLTARVSDGTYERLEWLIGDATGTVHQGGTADASVYRIYSMTKPIVSIAALQLIEEARLHLYHPIHLYLPEFKHMLVMGPNGPRPAAGPITVQHLLSHMSGLSYGFFTDAGALALNMRRVHEDARVTLREEATRIAKTPLAFDPGTGWRYSVSSVVLGALIEVVEGAPLGEILTRRVLAPLGMTETSFNPSADVAPRVPPMKGGGKGGMIAAEDLAGRYPFDNPDFARGGHGLFSTLGDYAKFSASLLATATGGEGPHLVSPHTLAAARQNYAAGVMPIALEIPAGGLNPGVAGQGFGLGFAVAQPAGASLARPGTFGWSGAAETWFNVDPVAGFHMVIMAQHLDWPGASYDFQNLAYGALR